MSWIQKLYETYELCANAPQFEKEPRREAPARNDTLAVADTMAVLPR